MLSGLCGLMYQILWARLFSFVLGNTYLTISIIVASFMFGLFFGAWLIGRYMEKVSNPLKLYAYLEILIGVYAFILPVTFGIITSIFSSAHTILYNIELLNFSAKFLLTLLLLIIPTGAMGATLPLAVEYFTNTNRLFENNISLFYAINTMGGAIGTLIAGFFVIEYLGIREGIFLTAILNLAIGFIVLFFLKKSVSDESPTKIETSINKNRIKKEKYKTKQKVKPQKNKSSINYKFILLTTAGLSGFTALAYEIVWTRGLKFLILNSTYGFASILFVFLLGIAIGGILAKRISAKTDKLVYIYGVLQIALGLFSIFTIYLLYTFAYTEGFQDSLNKILYDYAYSWQWGILAFISTALIIYLIPAILMGILFPLLNDLYFKNVLKKAGKTVSSIYAINTIGAIVGSLAAGFILIPSFGIKTSIYIVAVINLLIGIYFVVKSGLKFRPVILYSLPVLLIVVFLSGEGKYLFGNKEKKTDNVLFYEEGLMATVKVYERGKAKYMSIDGITIASTGRNLMQKEKLIAHLPFFLKKDAKDVLAVGLASGISVGSMTLHKDVKQIDCVELIKPVFKAAKYFTDYNYNIFNNDKVELINNDIYSYLIHSDKKYDIISSDGKLGTLHSGNTIMLSADYYELCKEHLKENGVFTQWIPIITPYDAMQIIIKSLTHSFKYVSIFYFYPSDILMVASENPIVFDKVYMDRVFENKNVKRELEQVNVFNSLSILSAFVGQYSEQDVPGAMINSFNKPVLEFTYLRDWKKSKQYSGGYRAKNLNYLTMHYANSDMNMLFGGLKNVNNTKLRENLYIPTLSFLKFATTNFIRGNYKIGLDGYMKFKKGLGSQLNFE
jgi:spermidine synthase